MKEAELRAAATCANCQRRIGEIGFPLFYRVTIERHMLNVSALQRQQGLGMIIGARLAVAMGPNEDMTQSLGKKELTICEKCSTQSVCIAQLNEQGQPSKFVGSSEEPHP